MGKSAPDRLEKYRSMREAGATPEPFGGRKSARPRLFVVQKHWATSLHFDFRLEWDGVLLSWAVPKGPSLDPEIKRLAMQTEDHPVEYADFEGEIPKGNYGAGHVIVWDQGMWVPLEDPAEGLEKGKLLFELRGHKLGGVWTIFQTKKDGKPSREWLLVKKPDGWAGDDDDVPQASIFSGLTVEQRREEFDPAPDLRARLEELGAPQRDVAIDTVKVMLAETAELAPDGDDWVHELKWDGFRLVCGNERLFYRSGREATKLYPEVTRATRLLPYDGVVMDGEVCILDEERKPDFQRLQSRAQLRRALEIEQASVTNPVVCYVFDLLAIEGFDLRGLPLVERKRVLKDVLPPAGPLRYTDHIVGRGRAFHEQVKTMGLEGVVSKQAESEYRAGRSSRWVKLRAERHDDFVVVGWTAPKGGRTGFGALHVGAFDGGECVYAGRVGTGFSDKQLDDLAALLEAREVDQPPCTGPVPRTKGHHWVRPEIVVEVRYKERTADGLLRQPAFLRLREDKRPEECIAPPARGLEEPPPEVVEDAPSFEPTNLHKVFWPKEGYTKGDLLDYYRAVGPALLPYLRDRPVVLTRYPDGIEGKSFYQKDAPEWVPDWIRTESIWSEDTERFIHYFLCDDVESLVFLANLGTIPIHVWSSRVTDLAKPDWCILDLDPKGAPFEHVVKIARAIKRLCDRVELTSYVKTSGSTGLHVLLPLGGQCTYDQSRGIGELIARIVEAELPDIATTVRSIRKRDGKVYLDFGQNAHGQLLVAPYSVRPLPGAPVSAPLRWSEVNARLTLDKFTMRTMPARLERQKSDPVRPVLDESPDLVAILARLAEAV